MSSNRGINQTIAIIGATGEVGQSVAIALRKLGFTDVRLGARHQPGCDVAERLKPFSVTLVDLQDSAALAEFVTTCKVVINCAGPSYQVQDRVAQIAMNAGANYVDVAGDEQLHERLYGLLSASPPMQNYSAILAAGLLPGLSTLMPRWLAATEMDRIDQLTVYTGGLERGSRMGAADFLLSLDEAGQRALAAIRDGVFTQRVLTPLVDVTLPFFPGYVSAQPYLSEEAERLAQALGIKELNWYNVLVGAQIRSELNRMRSQSWSRASKEELIAACDRLVTAAALDLAGREPFQLFVMILQGHCKGEKKTCTTVLRTNDSYRLSGAMGALAAAAIIRGDIPSGVHYAAEVLNPKTTMQALSALGVISSLDVLDGCLDSNEEVEGVL